MPKRNTKVLAAASCGGHWEQLLRIREAWHGCDTVYLTTKKGYDRFIIDESKGESGCKISMRVVPDASRWSILSLIRQSIGVAFVIIMEKPDVVVTTGASVGFFSVFFAKKIGCKTIWIDSIANSEEISLSGKRAASHSDVWITQWRHLATRDKYAKKSPVYVGEVL